MKLLKDINILWSLFFLEVQAEKADSGFSKTFYARYLFVFVKYLNKVLQPQNENKTFQKLIPILAIVNHRNCLDASPLLHSRILNIEKI